MPDKIIKNNIVNCAICKWRQADRLSIILGNYYKCSAQGGIYCIDVYNNAMCKKLFKII
jgi:hypothetical protein